MKVLKKSHTLGGTKQARPAGKVRLKTGYSLEKQTWKLNYQDFLPTPLPSNSKATDGYWEKSENFQLSGRTDGWMDGWTDGWMEGWMNGRTDGWVDGWMDGWMDGVEWSGMEVERLNEMERE